MKRIIALLMTLVMCLTLCACGSGIGSADIPTTEANISTNQETTEPEETTEQEEVSDPVWTSTLTTDEFGDVTEDSVTAISGTFYGTFSNTATSGSELTVDMSFIKKEAYNHYQIFVDLKEYNDTNAVYHSSDSVTFKMKIGGEITSISMQGKAPNGTLVAGSQQYGWGGDYLYNALYNGEDVRCIITIGSSEYNFTVTSDNFASVCEQNGYGLAPASLTVKEAVEIFVEDYCIYNEFAGEWMYNNLDKLELMDSEAIKQHLEGYFVEMSMDGGAFLAGNEDFAFPSWYVLHYSHSTNIAQCHASYEFNNSTMKLLINSYENGEKLAGYGGLRAYHKGGSVREMSVANNLLTLVNSKGDATDYQFYRITDDFFVRCQKDENGLKPPTLLFRCDGYEVYDIYEAVDYALKIGLHLIEN